MEWLTLVLGCTLMLLLYKIKSASRVQRLTRNIPGPSAFTVAKDSLNLIYQQKALTIPFQLSGKWVKKYGPVFRVSFLGKVMIFVNSAEHAALLVRGKKNVNRIEESKIMEDFLGEGIFSSNGEDWHKDRDTLLPVMSNENIKKMIPKLHNFTGGFLEDLKSKLSTTRCFKSTIQEHLTVMTFDTLINIKVSNEFTKEVFDISETVSEIISLRLTSHLYFNFIYLRSAACRLMNKCREKSREIASYVIKEWQEKLRTACHRDANEVEIHSMMTSLQHLITSEDHEASFVHEKVRSNVLSLAAASIATNTASLNAVLYLLGIHADIQEQVYREISEVLGDDENPSIQQLSEMKMLDRCVKETLRLYPPLIQIFRTATQDNDLGDYKIPVGCNFCVSIYDIHRDPEHWPEPEKYDPDRFLPENCIGRHPYAYIAFSAGSRNCIGKSFVMMILKYFLCVILKNFKVEAAVPREDLEMEFKLAAYPRNGFLIRMSQRNIAEHAESVE